MGGTVPAPSYTVRYGYGVLRPPQPLAEEERIDRIWQQRDAEIEDTNKLRLIQWMLKVREGGWFRRP